MKKIVIYVRNKDLRPSDYYRVIQFVKGLNGQFLIRSAVPDWLNKVSLSPDSKKPVRVFSVLLSYFCILFSFYRGLIGDWLYKPDCIIVVREIFPRVILPVSAFFLRKKARKYNFVWDFDDSIIGTEISQKESSIYFEYAKRIIVSTPYLKDMISSSTQRIIDVLCTTDGDITKADICKAEQDKQASYKIKVNMIWLATANNMPNLTTVLPYLDAAAKLLYEKEGKELCLKVVCNAKVLNQTDFLQVENIYWSHDTAIKELLKSHIGIMPLNDSEFARGKAGFKLIQYMAGALPVIASNTGFNSSIVKETFGFCVDQNSEDQWVKSVFALASDEELWKRCSRNSIVEWNNHYSYSSNLAFWQNLINNI